MKLTKAQMKQAAKAQELLQDAVLELRLEMEWYQENEEPEVVAAQKEYFDEKIDRIENAANFLKSIAA